MENPARLRDGDEKENLGLRGQEVLKEEPQKKKKLVVFEIDNLNNAENEYEVSNFKIEEIFRSQSKGFRGGDISGDDGLTLRAPSHGDHISTAKSCQLPFYLGDVSRMMFDEFGIDLIELQNRILELEKQLKNDNLELPPIFSDLKSQVENFRNKLETSERYRKSEFYKQPYCQRFQYRRTSSEKGRKIREKFLNIWYLLTSVEETVPDPRDTPLLSLKMSPTVLLSNGQSPKSTTVRTAWQKQQSKTQKNVAGEKEISESTKDWLKQPSFDTSQYEDEEILLFLEHMFVQLGFISKFDVPLPILRNFLYEVYKNYNEVPFHNFRHCFCVAQMMYVMIWSVDIPKKMGDLDTLILLTSCICHDLDHPGYNNIYQINARTELALLYNDISPLENHHCSVAFRILENPECNIFASVDKETFKEIREGIIRCILATDMARHNEILTQFKDIIPEFDFGNKAHKNLLSMILIKVADISNEARPMNVAEPWLDRLLMEFFKQSDAEKKEGLPVTPFMDRDKITKPSSQCSFIGFVLLPLFEALGELLPELHDLIIAPARYALDHYRRLNEAAKDERLRRKSVVDAINAEINEDSEILGMVKSGSGHSMRSRRSLSTCSQARQRSKSTDEFDSEVTPPSSPSALPGFPEDLKDVDEREEIEEEELEEEETVTEVEVSEKTLKFKISTEGSSASFPGRRSCPGSRKGSRERNQYLDNDVEWSRMMKDEDGRSLKRSITSETMNSRKGSSDSEKLTSGKTSRKNSGEFDDHCRRPSRQKDHRPQSNYNKKKPENRRKSLAVVERTREWDNSKRRKSVSSALETKDAFRSEKVNGRRESERKKNENFTLEKPESPRTENRCSRDFETSCWGLQNLKIDTLVFNKTPIIINKTLKNSLQQNVETEKSKSEDNLTIKGFGKATSSPVLENNINASKTDESLENRFATDPEKKKKLGSNGHLFLLTKLKHLKDRITFGRDSEDLGSLSGPNSAEKTGKPNTDNQNTSKECEDDSEKSRTLPKTKKPHRTSGKMKRGWRALIGKSEGNSSSSLEVLPPTTGTPSPVHPKPRRKTSMEEGKPRNAELSSAREKMRKSAWLSSPKKVGFLSRIGRGEEENAKQNFLNNLTSSFRKKGSKHDDENGASSSGSVQDGSKPN